MFPYIAFILTIAGLTAVNLLKERDQQAQLQPIRVPVKPNENSQPGPNPR